MSTEFSASLKKHFYTQGSAAATTSCRIPLLNSSGAPIGSDTPSNIMLQQPLVTNGLFIVTVESNYPRFRQPDQYASYTRSSSNPAVGVGIFEGGKFLVVALDEQATTKWATSNIAGGTSYKGREAAFADMDGRTNTSTIITTLGSDAPAATYCQGYSPSTIDSSDGFFGAGRWFLPSAGELWMIWSHLLELNRLITALGGTALSRSAWYWSSTEYSATDAWTLSFSIGTFNSGHKTYELSVRPVSAFY